MSALRPAYGLPSGLMERTASIDEGARESRLRAKLACSAPSASTQGQRLHSNPSAVGVAVAGRRRTVEIGRRRDREGRS